MLTGGGVRAVVPLKKEEHNETALVGKRRADRVVVKNITGLDGSPVDASLLGRSGTSTALFPTSPLPPSPPHDRTRGTLN
jgi:hypothetical protein